MEQSSYNFICQNGILAKIYLICKVLQIFYIVSDNDGHMVDFLGGFPHIRQATWNNLNLSQPNCKRAFRN